MPRKALLALCLVLSICSLALSFAAEAQPPARVFRIGWLSPHVFVPPASLPGGGNRGTFTRALNDLGYVAGRNLGIDIRYADGKDERLASLAAELVALKPDVIVAVETLATKAAHD